jgi:Nuclear condensing complex subunits, C-term domain
MICMGWLRSCEFNLIDLLKKLNVYENEQACSIIVETINDALGFSENPSIISSFADELSDHEIARFYKALKYGLVLSLDEDIEAAENESNIVLSSEILFAVNAALKVSNDSSFKEALLSQVIPDIPTLCFALERQASALIESIREKNLRNENELTFICMQLLRLAIFQQTNAMEEGSRRVFSAAMIGMLTNILTPDDLIENCVEALKHFESRRPLSFIHQVEDIVSNLNTKADESVELKGNYIIRLIMILSTSLEYVSATDAKQCHEVLGRFTPIIEPHIKEQSTKNALAQEAAVSCFGKLGLLLEPATVNSTFYPLLLSVVKSDESLIAVRVQAMLALYDYSVLLKNKDTEFCDIVSMFMNHSSFSVRCIAAEVSAKLLFAGRVDDSINSDWLAQLVILYFELDEFCTDNHESDVDERGSPVRLQQLLSTFFPALCIQSLDGQDALMGSVKPMLEIVGRGERSTKTGCYPNSSVRKSSRKSSKKERRVKNLPITKMVEFICSNVKLGEEAFAKVTVEKIHVDVCKEEVQESSPMLIACIQVADFLSKNLDNHSMVNVRSLCKFLGGLYIDENKEACEHLLMLKDATEELVMQLEDDMCIKYISPLNKQLDAIEIVDVESDSDVSIPSEQMENYLSVSRCIKQNLPLVVHNVDENIPEIFVTPKNATTAKTKESTRSRRALRSKTPN